MVFIRKFIPNFLISWYHLKLAFLGAVFYGFPSRRLKVIGVTGTNGKSTVVYLTEKILEQAGFKVASLSSIKFKIREKELPNDLKMTMPGRFKIQKFLRQALKAGCQYAVLEVTSEGIKQHRHRFIDFDVAVFTNLTPEHIEAHKSFERYKKAKGGLFKKTKKVHIVNLDDGNAEYFLQFSANAKIAFSFPEENSKSSSLYSDELLEKIEIVTATDIRLFPGGLNFKTDNTEFNLKLLGEFNVYNALAAICIGLSQEVNLEICKKALERVEGVPGRMEIVIKEPFTVIVDYAHTPDSLIKVYQTIRNSKFEARNSKQIQMTKIQNLKLVCVLGACGGGRDKWKRPEMGKIAAQYCDEIILTNEDPYNENPFDIIEDIERGFSQIPSIKSQTPKYMKILDRREAIKKALKLTKAGDVVIITGKGCEPWMCVAGNKKIPWDDREIVKEELKNL